MTMRAQKRTIVKRVPGFVVTRLLLMERGLRLGGTVACAQGKPPESREFGPPHTRHVSRIANILFSPLLSHRKSRGNAAVSNALAFSSQLRAYCNSRVLLHVAPPTQLGSCDPHINLLCRRPKSPLAVRTKDIPPSRDDAINLQLLTRSEGG